MSASDSESAYQLDESEIHDILRNDRRRRIIRYLRGTEGRITVNDLSEHIASIESGEDPAPRNVRKSVYVSLHQTHLPKLDGWGIIDYDADRGTLALRSRVEEVVVYMEVLAPDEIPWATYYLGLGVLALLTLLSAKFHLGLPDALGIEFWAWFYLLLFTFSAGYQAWQNADHRVTL